MNENDKIELAKNAAKSFSNNGEDWHDWWGQAWININGGNNNIPRINSKMAIVRSSEKLTEEYLTNEYNIPDKRKQKKDNLESEDLLRYLQKGMSKKSKKFLDLCLQNATMKEIGETFGKTEAWAYQEFARIKKLLINKVNKNKELADLVGKY